MLRRVALMLASVSCAGYAWRVQRTGNRMQGTERDFSAEVGSAARTLPLSARRHSQLPARFGAHFQSKILARLLVALNSADAFNPSGGNIAYKPGVHSRLGKPARTVAHPAASAAVKIPPRSLDARRLILVRHGSVARAQHDPPIPPGALYGGDLEVPLSDKGELEAEAAANIIGDYAESEVPDTVQVIASSPMKRAVFGAEAIASAVQRHSAAPLDVEMYEQLREIGRGQWVNLTRDEIADRWGADAFERCAREDEFGRSFGGEGIGDLKRRVLSARDTILEKMPVGTSAVVVSHMWVTRAIVADALGEPDVLNVDIPTASISVIDYGPHSAEVPLIGYKPELTPEAAQESAQEQQAQ